MRSYATSWSAGIAFALTTSVLSMPSVAQQTTSSNQPQTTVPEKEKKEKREQLETIIVTGTNIRDVSQVASLPLNLVTPEDIARQGPQELSATLRQNPAFSGGTLNGGQGGFFSGSIQTLNLLGLGDKYTLVLVDGRRFNAVTPTNVGNIPASAVSNIQILTEGGSSIYGSDAVAGVVNIILNKHYEGMEISGSYGDRAFGSNFGSHATEWMTDIKFGGSNDRAHFYADVEFRKRGGTKLIDTWEGRYSNLWENHVYTAPSNIILPNGNQVILDYHTFGPGSYSRNPNDYVPYDPFDYNSTIGQKQRARLQDRQPQQMVSGFGNIEYDLTNHAQLFSEVFYSSTRSSEHNEEWGVDFYGDAHLDFGPVPATNYWNPFGVDLRDVYYALPELGGVYYQSWIDTWRAVGGLRGDIGALQYEIGATYFWNNQTESWGNFYSDSGLKAAINRPGPAALNPFCYGCNTPEQLAGIDVSQQLETVSAQSIFDAKINGPIVKRDNYGLSFAAGAETRQEKWGFYVDPLTATGDVYFNQFSPDSQERRTTAVFGELAYNLEEGAGIPAVHKLTLDAAVRHDWIESVGGKTNPHFVAVWQPVSSAFALRASYGTSFTAPPISLLRPQTQVLNTVLIYPQFNNQTIPTDVVTGGNPNLTPETAKTVTAGFLVSPPQLQGSTLTVQYFDIRQRNVVLVPDPQAIVYGTFPGTVIFTPGQRPQIDATPRNVGGRNVQGFEFNLDLHYATARTGTFGLKWYGVYTTKFDVDNGSGFMSVLGQFQNYLFNYSSTGALGTIVKLRWNGGPFWTDPTGALTFSFTGNYVKGYADLGVADGFPTDRNVSPFLTWDFNVTADLNRTVPGLSASLGILNIWAKQPPYVQGFGETYVYYDPGLSNSLGRTAFVGLKYHF